MSTITFIGDVHGMFATQHKLLERIKKKTPSDLIIQVGDLGMGFHAKDPDRRFPSNYKFIRGNHDCPEVCRAHPNYFGDYGYFPPYKMFYMGGADSIDKNYRIPNLDWWENEQLSYSELQDAIDLCVKTQPEIIVTHDAPKFLYNQLTLGSFVANGQIANRTCNALNTMFELHQPKLWIFGHHHTDQHITVRGTEFYCAQILTPLTFQTPDMRLIPQPKIGRSKKLILP